MGPTAAVELLFKILPFEKSPRWLRTSLILAVGMVLLYYVAGLAQTGATAMQVKVPYVLFLAFCAAGGLGIGQFAWMQGKGEDGKTAASTPTPVTPVPPALINQSTTGAQSPTAVGNATIIYHAPTSAGPSPEEMKYRSQLADEIAASRHSLDKSRNRWYTYSLAMNRPEADKNWQDPGGGWLGLGRGLQSALLQFRNQPVSRNPAFAMSQINE